MNDREHYPDINRIINFMKEHVAYMTDKGQAAGFQITGLIHILANQYDHLFMHSESPDEISGPRMGLLVRLLDEERRGSHAGITPSELSRNQHVSRNTISALLRGLEDQGLIERQLDPTDRRLFRIRLTDSGRSTIKTIGPQRIAKANQMVAALTPEEQQQLIVLLSKLFNSLQTYCQFPPNQNRPADVQHPQDEAELAPAAAPAVDQQAGQP